MGLLRVLLSIWWSSSIVTAFHANVNGYLAGVGAGRRSCCPTGSGQGDGPDGAGPCLAEWRGAGLQCCACGTDVVDEAHSTALQRRAMVRKRVLYIGQALLGAQPDLRVRVAGALQGCRVDGDAAGLAQSLSQHGGLVEPALTQAPGMKWDGQEKLGRH